MNVDGIIFDMDGTITAPYLDFDTIKAKANVGDIDLIDYLAQVDGAERERVRAILREFEDDGVANAQLNPGARVLLNFLSRKQIPTALLTRNTRRSVDAVCRKLRLKFDITISREEGPHKPAPEPVLKIARRWKTRPQELLFVGDYFWDVRCARNAGARSVVLLNGGEVPDWAQEADFRIKRLTELIRLIKRESS